MASLGQSPPVVELSSLRFAHAANSRAAIEAACADRG